MQPRQLLIICALWVALAFSCQGQDHAPLKLLATIPLPGLHDGDFDHFAPDVDGHRLFLTGEENEKVLVLDTNKNQLTHTMEDVKAPHAILFRKDVKKLFIVAGDAAAVQVYDSDSYKLLGEIKVSVDADSIAYDPATHYLYVVNGGREAHTPYSLISVIDTDNSKKLRDIKIDTNHVEAIVLEKSGPRMFINLTGKSAVGILRSEQVCAVGHLAFAGGRQNECGHGFGRTGPPLVCDHQKSGKADCPELGQRQSHHQLAGSRHGR